MSVNVGHLARKRVVKDLAGNIIDMMDETNGGYIVKGRQIVNQERWEELQAIEEDKKLAAKAISMQKVDTNAPDRTIVPGKVEELEKKVTAMDDKLNAILEALKK
jgi:hypothetical protein